MPRSDALRICLAVGLWAVGSAGLSTARAARAVNAIEQARTELETDYAEKLEALASWCEAQGLRGEAQRTRQAARPRDPWTLYLVTLPARQAAAKAQVAAPEWESKFSALGQAQAAALLGLARQAMRAKRASLAYELVLEMLRVDPQNDEGRKLLGFVKFRGEWHTPFEAEKLKARYAWHERFGWLPQGHLARYEAGERYYNGKWISAEEEARIRSDIRSAWYVQTEHYSIRTNVSLEAGVELGQRLERLYRAWQQTFAAYSASPDQLIRLFEGRATGRRADGPRHLVVYFRDRDEYRRALAMYVPEDVETTGIYIGDARTAYFYASEQVDHTTLYHEASHQLFSESKEVATHIGLRGNFWIVEGIACYLESFTEGDDFDTLGGTASPRLAAARHRALEDNFYVPLAQLVMYGMNDLQRDPRIAMLYSQSAGLAHFLMHYDNGRYRDALLGYLAAIYAGEDRAETLAELTGRSYADLDEEYRVFLRSLPAETPTRER